ETSGGSAARNRLDADRLAKRPRARRRSSKRLWPHRSVRRCSQERFSLARRSVFSPNVAGKYGRALELTVHNFIFGSEYLDWRGVPAAWRGTAVAAFDDERCRHRRRRRFSRQRHDGRTPRLAGMVDGESADDLRRSASAAAALFAARSE